MISEHLRVLKVKFDSVDDTFQNVLRILDSLNIWVLQQNDGSSVNVEETAAAEVKIAPTDNGMGAPALDSIAGSDEKPLKATAEAPQQEGDAEAAAAAQEISRKIEVPNSKIGVLIGKYGETIRNIQNSSGAKIQITKDADVDSNAPTRSVELIGSLGSVDKAEQLIKSIIAEFQAEALIATGYGSGRPEQFEMTVPENKVGLIIGKGGETIKGMQKKSGARIQLVPIYPPEGVTLAERTVRVTGYMKQIEVASDLIKQALNQGQEGHGYLENKNKGYPLHV